MNLWERGLWFRFFGVVDKIALASPTARPCVCSGTGNRRKQRTTAGHDGRARQPCRGLFRQRYLSARVSET